MPNPFEATTDPVRRAALEEALLTGACKYVMGEYTPPSDMAEPGLGFPPEPSTMLAVTVAYLRKGAPDNLQQEFIPLSDALPSRSTIISLYRRSVDRRHANMPFLLASTQEVPGLQTEAEILQFCMGAVQRQGNCLLAAHLIARMDRDNSFVDALAYPRCIAEAGQLRVRDRIAPLVAGLAADDPLRDQLRPILHGEESARTPFAIAAANFLPPSFVLQAALPRG